MIRLRSGMEEVSRPSFTLTAGSWLAATSTQRSSRAEVNTASVISAARRPSENVGIAATAEPCGALVEVGDERVEAVGIALRVAARKEGKTRGGRRQGGGIAAHGSSGTRGARTRALPGAPDRTRACFLGAVELDPEPVLATRGDLAETTDPIAPASVSNWMTPASIVTFVERDAPGARAMRSAARAERRAMRWPETNSARSHQCDADVGERTRGAAEPLVHAPVVVLRAQEPVLQIGAVQKAQRPGLPAADALACLAHRRVVAVDERHRGLEPASRRRRRPAAARRRRRAPAASRRSRACPRPAPPRRAGGGGCSAAVPPVHGTSSTMPSRASVGSKPFGPANDRAWPSSRASEPSSWRGS